MKTTAIERLARSLRGALHLPGAQDYDDARRVFNLARAGRPVAIVECAGADDVELAVRFAADENLTIAVRGGGYSIGGQSAATGALAIDLRRLAEVDLDAAGTVVAAGGGCNTGALIAGLEARDVAVPGAFDPRVGIAGLALGGGYGLLTRRFGLTCDSLVGADVVTAGGARVRAEDDPDLLWALRGAGANFGVTTRLRFRTHPLPPVVVSATSYRLGGVRDILRAARDLIVALPDEATVYVGLDPGAGTVGLYGFHVGPETDARPRLSPFARLGSPLRQELARVPHGALHRPNQEVFPENHHHAWNADFVRALSDEALDVLAQGALQARGEIMWIVIEHLGGAVARVDAGATAFPHRDARFGIVSAVRWQPPASPDRALDLQQRLHRALRPFSIGRYVNYIDEARGEDDLAAAYGANLPRLRELKRRFDPDNRFRHNVNIDLGG